MLFRCPSPESGHFCNSLCVCHVMHNSVNQKSKGGWNVSLPTTAVCLETLQMIVITPLHVMCFPKRAVTPGWGKKRFNCRAWEYIYSIFQEIRTPSTELKQSVDLSRIFRSSTAGTRPRTLRNSKNHSKTGKSWKATICWLFAGVWDTPPLCWHTLIILCICWHLRQSSISRGTYTSLWVLFFGVKCSRINLQREDCWILHLLAQMHDCVMTEGTSA